MHEEWRDVPGYEGYYQVSSFGNVKSVARCFSLNERAQRCVIDVVMKQHVIISNGGNEYLAVWLRKAGQRRKFFVHRLVAITFLPNPEQKEVVNHRDSDTKHNAVLNLEWATYSENNRHYRERDSSKDGQEQEVF